MLATLAVGPGCQLLRKSGSISSKDVTVQGVPLAGTPASLNTADAQTVVTLPTGSEVKVERIAAQSALPATEDTPAVAAKPAVETTTIKLAGLGEFKKVETTVAADTGTVDTSVAKHALDVADRKWLLWAALACGIGGIVLKSLLPAWPGLSNGLLIAAPIAFSAWKLSDVPSWLWAVVLLVMGCLALGYKRAQWDKNGDGIPDIIQKQ